MNKINFIFLFGLNQPAAEFSSPASDWHSGVNQLRNMPYYNALIEVWFDSVKHPTKFLIWFLRIIKANEMHYPSNLFL
jgi:hypothetical protein